MTFVEEMNQTIAELERVLQEVVSYDASLEESKVTMAMGYSLLGGGKRIRGLLVIKLAEAFGGNSRGAYLAAAAIEMIHAYSLIHDDLPCMDDDALRRGKPTNHRVYGEAMALLAGDALLNGAFELLAGEEMESLVGAKTQVALIRCLSDASGRFGMIGGQTIDIHAEGRLLSEQELTHLHGLKTGALIQAAVLMGGILGGQSKEILCQLKEYGQKIGLAFQIQDDMLDVVGDPKTLGKNIGSDHHNLKTTYITLKGLEVSRQMVEKLFEEGMKILMELGLQEGFVGQLTQALYTRKH